MESFQEVLDSTQVLAKAKDKVATDEEAAKACAERAAAVKEKIDNGKEAEIFKEKIAALNPIETIESKAEMLKAEAARKTSRVFEPYGDVLTNKEEAKRLVGQFTIMSSDCIAELTSELESVINREVMETGEHILMEYQEKLEKIDEDATNKQLDFGTADLIKRCRRNNWKLKRKHWKLKIKGLKLNKRQKWRKSKLRRKQIGRGKLQVRVWIPQKKEWGLYW